MRRADWVKQLQEAIESAALRPFDYGSFNCGLFAAECIDAITDSTRVAELKSQFSDEASAKAFVEAAGSMEAAVTARLGEPSANWAHARRGDVCLMQTDNGPALGVCVGSLVSLMALEVGLTHYPINRALKVWRID